MSKSLCLSSPLATRSARPRTGDAPIGTVTDQQSFPCRCTIGEDHLDENSSWGNEPDEPDYGTEGFAGDEEIYDSSGHDEDYDFRP